MKHSTPMKQLSLINNWFEVHSFRKITDRFRVIHRMLIKGKKNQKVSTCNQVDLETLESRLIMPKNLPVHCSSLGAGCSKDESIIEIPLV